MGKMRDRGGRDGLDGHGGGGGGGVPREQILEGENELKGAHA